eukprot:Rmarinus@m.9038
MPPKKKDAVKEKKGGSAPQAVTPDKNGVNVFQEWSEEIATMKWGPEPPYEDVDGLVQLPDDLSSQVVEWTRPGPLYLQPPTVVYMEDPATSPFKTAKPDDADAGLHLEFTGLRVPDNSPVLRTIAHQLYFLADRSISGHVAPYPWAGIFPKDCAQDGSGSAAAAAATAAAVAAPPAGGAVAAGDRAKLASGAKKSQASSRAASPGPEFRTMTSSPVATSELSLRARARVPDVNPSGKYCIRLFHNLAWRAVFIDDKIPVTQDRIPLLVTTGRPNELWPLLLTKALLKLHAGRHESICRYPWQIVMNVTGWLPETLSLRGVHTWNMLVATMQDGHSMYQCAVDPALVEKDPEAQEKLVHTIGDAVSQGEGKPAARRESRRSSLGPNAAIAATGGFPPQHPNSHAPCAQSPSPPPGGPRAVAVSTPSPEPAQQSTVTISPKVQSRRASPVPTISPAGSPHGSPSGPVAAADGDAAAPGSLPPSSQPPSQPGSQAPSRPESRAEGPTSAAPSPTPPPGHRFSRPPTTTLKPPPMNVGAVVQELCQERTCFVVQKLGKKKKTQQKIIRMSYLNLRPPPKGIQDEEIIPVAEEKEAPKPSGKGAAKEDKKRKGTPAKGEEKPKSRGAGSNDGPLNSARTSAIVEEKEKDEKEATQPGTPAEPAVPVKEVPSAPPPPDVYSVPFNLSTIVDDFGRLTSFHNPRELRFSHTVIGAGSEGNNTRPSSRGGATKAPEEEPTTGPYYLSLEPSDTRTTLVLCIAPQCPAGTPAEESAYTVTCSSYDWMGLKESVVHGSMAGSDLQVAILRLRASAHPHCLKIDVASRCPYVLSVSSERKISLGSSEQVLAQLLDVHTTVQTGPFTAVTPASWEVLLRGIVEVETPTTLRCVMSVPEELAPMVEVTLTDTGTSETEEIALLDAFPVELRPNKLGYAITASVRGSAEVPEGNWELALTSSPAMNVEFESCRWTDTLQEEYQPVHYYPQTLLFRKSMETQSPNFISVLLTMSDEDIEYELDILVDPSQNTDEDLATIRAKGGGAAVKKPAAGGKKGAGGGGAGAGGSGGGATGNAGPRGSSSQANRTPAETSASSGEFVDPLVPVVSTRGRGTLKLSSYLLMPRYTVLRLRALPPTWRPGVPITSGDLMDVSWKLQLAGSANVVISEDTLKSDFYNEIKQTWEKRSVGRLEKAQQSLAEMNRSQPRKVMLPPKAAKAPYLGFRPKSPVTSKPPTPVPPPAANAAAPSARSSPAQNSRATPSEGKKKEKGDKKGVDSAGAANAIPDIEIEIVAKPAIIRQLGPGETPLLQNVEEVTERQQKAELACDVAKEAHEAILSERAARKETYATAVEERAGEFDSWRESQTEIVDELMEKREEYREKKAEEERLRLEAEEEARRQAALAQEEAEAAEAAALAAAGGARDAKKRPKKK